MQQNQDKRHGVCFITLFIVLRCFRLQSKET
nr:MAG TPA_asm: hypothetical protein [Caudoviricetes sp.]